MSLENENNQTNKDIDCYEEYAYYYDPKEEHFREGVIKDEMENNDVLAIILAGFKVFSPFILTAMILIFLITR